MKDSWVTFFMDLASVVGAKSKDPNTHVGCVIVRPDKHQVVAIGYNGFPRGMTDDVAMLSDRSVKLKYMVHAEANAICSAASLGAGVSLEGCVAFVTKHPCSACAGLLVQAGVVAVYCPSDGDGKSNWAEDKVHSSRLLEDCGVQVHFI